MSPSFLLDSDYIR